MALKEAIKSFYPKGLTSDSSEKTTSSYCALINERHFDHQMALTENKIVHEICDEKEDRSTLFFPPKVVVCESVADFDGCEVFGPVIPVIVLENSGEAVKFIQERPGPLAAYLFTNDGSLINHFVHHVDCGSLAVNDCTRQVFNDTLQEFFSLFA